MKKKNRCMPVGSLPYTTDSAATKMMVKLFEDNPYLPMFPLVLKEENLLIRTLSNIPGVHVRTKGKGIAFSTDDDVENLKKKIVSLDLAFNNPTSENLEKFSFDSYFLPKYCKILERLKPAETVVNLMGPFTASQNIFYKEDVQILADKYYRKLIIQAISVKALWIVNKIKELSPETKPIIVLEEPLLYKAGSVKRENEEVTVDVLVNLFSKVISKIKEAGAKVCVQSFSKCDWQIPIESGADIISFDAYNHPNNLNIIPDKVNEFLANGGIINWAIVPVTNEALVKSLTVDNLYTRLINTMEGLINSGTSERLTYNRSTVSIQGDIDGLPLIFAEKALILSNSLAKKIPVKS